MAQNKTCEKCGKEFGCEAETGKPCWCMGFQVSGKNLTELKQKYNDCLCPECLEQLSQT